MKTLLINILRGCFLNTIASPELLLTEFRKLTMNKTDFICEESDGILVIKTTNEDAVSIYCTVSKTGYITDIKIK